jgi:hypothetical protein
VGSALALLLTLVISAIKPAIKDRFIARSSV